MRMALRLKPGVVIVDKREERSGIADFLRKLGLSVRYEVLEVGDYLLPGDILVERKTVSDFISSLLDGRLFDQAANLISSTKNPTMIIEGDMKKALRRFENPNAVWGALASIGYDFKITLFHTSDIEETAALLAAISRRKRSEKEEVYLKPKKKRGELEELQLSIAASLPGIGPARAKKLLEGFRTLRALFNADPSELSRIGGIPHETAVKIYDLINAEYGATSSGTQSKIDHFRD